MIARTGQERHLPSADNSGSEPSSAAESHSETVAGSEEAQPRTALFTGGRYSRITLGGQRRRRRGLAPPHAAASPPLLLLLLLVSRSTAMASAADGTADSSVCERRRRLAAPRWSGSERVGSAPGRLWCEAHVWHSRSAVSRSRSLQRRATVSPCSGQHRRSGRAPRADCPASRAAARAADRPPARRSPPATAGVERQDSAPNGTDWRRSAARPPRQMWSGKIRRRTGPAAGGRAGRVARPRPILGVGG